MPITQKWVNSLNSQRLVTVDHPYYHFPNYDYVPDQNPTHKHFEVIDEAINNKDDKKLLELLTFDLQCSAVQDSLPIDLDDHGNVIPAKYLIGTRPFVEGLILLNKDNFIQLLRHIMAMESIALYRALVQSLEQTSLKPQQLFGWYTLQRNKTLKGIKDLKVYGEHTIKAHDGKGTATVKLSEALANDIGDWDIRPYQDKSAMPVTFEVMESYRQDFLTACRKLKVCQLLHRDDSVFNLHRNPLDLVADVILGVAGLGIFNLINYMSTGNILFFNKTATQTRITELEEIIRPYPLSL